jgi:hypothetical protein
MVRVAANRHRIEFADGRLPRREPARTSPTLPNGCISPAYRRLRDGQIIRKGVFFAYTYRWVHTRETVSADRPGLTPVQRQLLGLEDGDADHAWGHYPSEVPLYRLLKEQDLLDPGSPPLKP